MMYLFQNPVVGAKFGFGNQFDQLRKSFSDSNHLFFLWNRNSAPIELLIDSEPVSIPSQCILSGTHLQQMNLVGLTRPIYTLMFNREFYCIHTNDTETSCNGLLFYGTTNSPVLTLEPDEADRLETLSGVLKDEFETRDVNQEEMLRLLLKRFIIRCTRLVRKQMNISSDQAPGYDIIRQFNVLVEEHFRKEHSVSGYATLMNKSPKTVSNAFSRLADTTPLTVIHNRIVLEAKRLLYYTNTPVKEIASELGFSDPAQFSRFFSRQTRVSATEFRNSAGQSSGRLRHQ